MASVSSRDTAVRASFLRQLYPQLAQLAQNNLESWGSSLEPRSSGKFQVLDFFCGCGGMSAGFAAASRVVPLFKILGGIDIDRDAAATFSSNMQSPGIESDIRKLEADSSALAAVLDQVRYNSRDPLVLIGCAPCQGFTSHRKKRWDSIDHRNSLIEVFCRLAVRLRPVAIVMENVPEMLSAKYWEYFQSARDTLVAAGYVVQQQIFNFASFGLPQQRFRSVLIAMKRPFLLPPPLLEPESYKTVRQAIGHLPAVAAGETDRQDPMHRSASHRRSTLETIKAVPKDGGSRPVGVGPRCLDQVKGFYDVYGRLAWDKPSITITHYARNPASGRYVHPVQDRGLTIREAATLQGFPVGFRFLGTFDSVFKQIGEAVPPVFSAALAAWVAIELLSPPPKSREVQAHAVQSLDGPVSSSFSSVIAGLKTRGRANGVYVR